MTNYCHNVLLRNSAILAIMCDSAGSCVLVIRTAGQHLVKVNKEGGTIYD